MTDTPDRIAEAEKKIVVIGQTLSAFRVYMAELLDSLHGDEIDNKLGCKIKLQAKAYQQLLQVFASLADTILEMLSKNIGEDGESTG